MLKNHDKMTNWKDRGFVNHDFINMTKKKKL